ncbi:MAG: (d)CMP kinase [Lachnospiraceae bacterium]|nr:(d)CMP kinase [Lachnospiraceae bacterium]
MNDQVTAIAIDGPAGAGKSTIAKRVAKDLGYIYVDTGAMYRAMAIHFIRKGISPEDTAGIETNAESASVTIKYINGEQRVYLNDEDVTAILRTPEVSNMASVSSAVPKVRLKLVELQRELARTNNVVMDGRDIGSYVLPDARIKIYMTAGIKERAKRRYNEMLEKGQECDLAQIEKEIEERDYRDMHRDFAPLVQAPDATLIDTSTMSIEEVAETVKNLVYGPINYGSWQ